MAEFTGERVIPGKVDVDLLNEHFARYTFAARLARGKRVLDAGCGTGYGSAELAPGAHTVVGVDVAAEAVAFARAHYAGSNLEFQQASCTALPYGDAAFDLVVAFEVIEHLEDWRGFLGEARRVLAPNGQFIVSTPNRLYYNESRGSSGANPFHVHEFDFEEFRSELGAVFPYVSLFLENHVEAVTFEPCEAGQTMEARVDAGAPASEEAHFFLAVCARRPQIGNPTFVYVPRTANVLRERGRHIALLEGELRTKNEWLKKALEEHQELMRLFATQQQDLERSNHWAEGLNREVATRDARIGELGARLGELDDEAAAARAACQAKILELEQELGSQAEAAAAARRDLEKKTAELASTGAALDRAQGEREERTARALHLDQQRRELAAQLERVRRSRWLKLGRRFGLGPALPE